MKPLREFLSSASPTRAAWVCAALALAFALPKLGDLDGLGHPDEAYYLSIVTDMVDTGHVMPTHMGSYIYQKPPLVFWTGRLSMALFGRNAAAARLPGALAAAVVCGAGALLAAEVAGAEAALLTGLLLLGCLGVTRFGRELMIDLPLAACLTATFLWLTRALRSAPRALFWTGFFASVSLGIKGPIGPAVILFATLGALWSLRRFDLLSRGALWLGLAAGLPLCLPWYIWAVSTHFHDFWAMHILDQHFSRFDAPHGQNRFNLLIGAAVYALPFTLLAAQGLARVVDAPFRARHAVTFAWLAAFSVIFGLPKEHGLHYPILILPPLALLAADVALHPTRLTRWLRVATALSLALAGAVLLSTSRFTDAPLLVIGVASGALLIGAVEWLRQPAASVGYGTLAVAFASTLAIGWLAPFFAGPLIPSEAAALGRDRPVGVYGEHPGPYNLQAGWPGGYEIWGTESFRHARDRGDLILIRDHMFDSESAAVGLQPTRIATWRRARPYLSADDVLQAWREGNLDRLRETNGLYELKRGGLPH